ncbi:MAG TPA: hypothetical protein PKW21_05680, partial [Rhabdaerophilum sp.]|nr:hypothetical protein [Rhabdaerophilum sp.]
KAVEIINILIMMGLLAYLMQFAWRNTVLMHDRLDGALQLPGSYYHGSMLVGFALMIRTLIAKFLAVVSRKEA